MIVGPIYQGDVGGIGDVRSTISDRGRGWSNTVANMDELQQTIKLRHSNETSDLKIVLSQSSRAYTRLPPHPTRITHIFLVTTVNGLPTPRPSTTCWSIRVVLMVLLHDDSLSLPRPILKHHSPYFNFYLRGTVVSFICSQTTADCCYQINYIRKIPIRANGEVVWLTSELRSQVSISLHEIILKFYSGHRSIDSVSTLGSIRSWFQCRMCRERCEGGSAITLGLPNCKSVTLSVLPRAD